MIIIPLVVRGKLRGTVVLKPLLLERNGGLCGGVLLRLLPVLVENKLLRREGLLLTLPLVALRAPRGRMLRYNYVIVLVLVLLLFVLLEWSSVLIVVVVVIRLLLLIAIRLRGAGVSGRWIVLRRLVEVVSGTVVRVGWSGTRDWGRRRWWL